MSLSRSARRAKARRLHCNVRLLRMRWTINRQLGRLNFSRRHHHGGRIWFEANTYAQVGGVAGLSWGGGAGYMDPKTKRRGWTAYFAINSGSRDWQMRYRDRRSFQPVEIGVTRNGNRVPYVSH